MKSLLKLMLIHYFTVGKRSTPARATRKVDREIRALCIDDDVLKLLVDDCKRVGEARKRNQRDKDRARVRAKPWSHPKGVEYVPCHRAKK